MLRKKAQQECQLETQLGKKSEKNLYRSGILRSRRVYMVLGTEAERHGYGTAGVSIIVLLPAKRGET
jgi:hypothetical protein